MFGSIGFEQSHQKAHLPTSNYWKDITTIKQC